MGRDGEVMPINGATWWVQEWVQNTLTSSGIPRVEDGDGNTSFTVSLNSVPSQEEDEFLTALSFLYGEPSLVE